MGLVVALGGDGGMQRGQQMLLENDLESIYIIWENI